MKREVHRAGPLNALCGEARIVRPEFFDCGQDKPVEGYEHVAALTIRPSTSSGRTELGQGGPGRMGFGLDGSERAAVKVIRAGLIAVLGVVLAMPVQAKEGDTFRPFVSYTRYYDSNLYRLAESEYSLVPQLSDQYGVLSAGLKVDWKPGRQQIMVSASKDLVRFSRYTKLNYDGSDYQLQWNWRLGNHWTGQAGTTENLTQSSFSDLGQQINNLVTRKRRFGRAEWEFHPRWRIGGGLEESDYVNSALSLDSQNAQQQARDVVLSYDTPKGSSLRAQVRNINAEFPNLQCLSNAFPFCFEETDNSYKQTEYNLLGDWGVSGKLKVRGQAGWVDRQYENVQRSVINFFPLQFKNRPDFSGFAGRISADWYATGKTLLSVSIYQELGGAQDINASSVLKKGASVNGVWLIREKWRLNAGATFENRDFKGDPGTTQLQRNDDTISESLSISYMPIEAVSVDVGVSAGRRDSNISVEDYQFHMLFANVRADF